ncbi:tetratricopeptide repeat protein [Erythrobacter sp. GH1-10]|uniref:tetratricopeptide repeat protein n=1 Tax=Erythrobacter sp. GH1-10 TaxID=3349334 RepID=UPI003877FC78
MKLGKIILCGVAAVSLGGCQSFLADLGLAKRSASDASVASTDGMSRVELGRAALKAGAPGTAIHHFERAVLDPAQAPDAYNGMGVAYAQLGREDLAERFFNAALMLRPHDQKIARNLERLYKSDIGNSARALAKKETEARAVLAQAEADAVAEGLLDRRPGGIDDRGPVAIDSRRGALQRNSKKEVLISGATPAPMVEAPATRKPQAEAASETPEVTKDRQGTVQPTKISAALPLERKYFDFTEVACIEAPNRQDEAAPGAMQIAMGKYPIRVAIDR